MIDLFLVEILLSTLAAASYGIGSHFARTKFHTVKLAQGLMLILLALELLSLLKISTRIVIPFLITSGLLLFIRFFYNHYPAILKAKKDLLVFLATAILVQTYLIITTGFPEAYNFHDDYQKYFVHPAKYLGQAFFGDSPLSTLGKETLGGQAIAQSIFIFFLGFEGVNLFDAVFCKALLAIGILEIGHRYRRFLSGLLVATISLAIHQQYVNISSIYSLALTCFCIVVLHHELLSSSLPKREFNNIGLLLAISYAFSITLKTSHLILPLIHFPLVFITLLYSTSISKNGSIASKELLVWGIRSTACGLAYLIPSLIMPLRFYFNHPGLDGMGAPTTPNFYQILNLLDSTDTFYGAPPLLYTLTVITSAALSIHALVITNVRTFKLAAVSAALALIFISIYLIAFIGNEFHTFETVLRYSIPFVIGFSSTGLIFSLCAFETSEKTGLSDGLTSEIENNKPNSFVGNTALILLLVSWAPMQLKFVHQFFNCGSILAFSELACSEEYLAYNEYVLSGNAGTRIRKLQNSVPEGEAILVWINYAHHLDFSRNTIIEIDTAGLRNPWAVVPDANYLLIDLAGYATRSKNELMYLQSDPSSYDRDIWKASLKFIEFLEENLVVQGLVNDDELFLYRIALPEKRLYK